MMLSKAYRGSMVVINIAQSVRQPTVKKVSIYANFYVISAGRKTVYKENLKGVHTVIDYVGLQVVLKHINRMEYAMR